MAGIPDQTRGYCVDQLIDLHFKSPARNVVPQADDLDKVLSLVSFVGQGRVTTDDAIVHFGYTERQSEYYGEAAEYLGLITRDPGTFRITKLGSEYISVSGKEKTIFAAKLVINSWVFIEIIRRARQQEGHFSRVQLLLSPRRESCHSEAQSAEESRCSGEF